MVEISGGKLRFSPGRGVEAAETKPASPLVMGARFRVEVAIDSISRGAVAVFVGGNPTAHWTEPGLQIGEVIAGPLQVLRVEGVTTDAVIDRVSAREILAPNPRAKNRARVPLQIDPELEGVVSEDFDYLTAVIARGELADFRLSNVDMRYTSVVLRRLLYDGDLRRVAAARRHKLVLARPDIAEQTQHAESDERMLFYMGGKIAIRGMSMTRFSLALGGGDPKAPAFTPTEEDRDPVVCGSLKAFMRQPVFLVRTMGMQQTQGGTQLTAVPNTISRESVIRYVAHKGGGGHYDRRRGSEGEWALEFIERAFCIRQFNEGNRAVELYFDDKVLHDAAFRLRRPHQEALEIGEERLNPVFLQLFSATHYLLKSRSIQDLIALIRRPSEDTAQTTEMIPT